MKRLASAIAILLPAVISCSGSGNTGDDLVNKAVSEKVKSAAGAGADIGKNGTVSVKKDGRELSISANGWANGALRSTAKEPPVPPGGRIASRIAGLEDVTFNIEVDAELPQIEKFYSKAFADAGFSEKSSVKAEGLFHGHFSGPEGDAQIYAFTAGSSRKVTVVMPLAR